MGRRRVSLVALSAGLLLLAPTAATADCSGPTPLEPLLGSFRGERGVETDDEAVVGFVLVEVIARAPATLIGSDRHRGAVVRHWGETDGIALTRSLDPGLVAPFPLLFTGDDCRWGGPLGSRALLAVRGPEGRRAADLVDVSGPALQTAVAELDALDVPAREDPVTTPERAAAWVAAWWPYALPPVALVAAVLAWLSARDRRRRPSARNLSREGWWSW